MTPLLAGVGLEKRFGPTPALAGVDVSVAPGEIVAVMGPSGSGKSTLLHCLAGIFRPDAGEVHFDGRRIDTLSETERSALRLARFGFVFQFGDLVPELTLAENVALPLWLSGGDRRTARSRAHEALGALGAVGAADRRAGDASGGEVQRAAVARALVHSPAVVLADEPTGALDSTTGELVLEALVDAATRQGAAVVIVTHEPRVAAYANREIIVRDGRVAGAARLSR